MSDTIPEAENMGPAQSDKDKVNQLIDGIIVRERAEVQYDSFYVQSAEELKRACGGSFNVISKRFLKATPDERDTILKLLKHFSGVEHIRFLQDFVKREVFLPRNGMLMLEIFNKSDAMLEDGLASRLLEFDSLAQRIKAAAESGSLNEAIAEEFISRNAKEQTGIAKQLADELKTQIAPFVCRVLSADEAAGKKIISLVTDEPSLEAFKLLEALYSVTARKDISKLLKKMAHALKQKGVKVEVPQKETPKAAVFKKAELPEARAFVSRVDAEGCRLIFMIKPTSAYETKIFNIMVSDSGGLLEMDVINSFRKESNQFVEKLLSDKKNEFMEFQPADAAFLVGESCQKSEALGKIISSNVSQWRVLFKESLDRRKKAMIYDHYSPEEIRKQPEWLERTKELFDGTDIEFWFVVSREAKAGWAEMSDIINSPLVLTDEQQRERIRKLVDETVVSFYTAEKKQAFKRRLEEIAYSLHAAGDSDRAKIALASALAMEENSTGPASSAFCSMMIERGFEFIKSAYNESPERRAAGGGEKKRSSIIV